MLFHDAVFEAAAHAATPVLRVASEVEGSLASGGVEGRHPASPGRSPALPRRSPETMKTAGCSWTRTPNIERSISNLEGRRPAQDWLCRGRGDEGTSGLGVGCWALDVRGIIGATTHPATRALSGGLADDENARPPPCQGARNLDPFRVPGTFPRAHFRSSHSCRSMSSRHPETMKARQPGHPASGLGDPRRMGPFTSHHSQASTLRIPSGQASTRYEHEYEAFSSQGLSG